MEKYFVIYFGGDNINVSSKTKEEIEKMLKSDIENQEDNYIKTIPKGGLGMDGDDYPLYQTLIIKGKLIIPEVVETVKNYKIE